MGTPISPGVYSTIIDLSNYVGAVPGTIGFVAGLTKQGEDNKFKFFGSRTDFIRENGSPNINTYGKNYGQGPYIAYNYLGESGSLFWMRCLPNDAAYSNLQINGAVNQSGVASIQLAYNTALNNKDEINTALVGDSTSVFPICILYPIGRGDYYNGLSVRFTKYSNPLAVGIYVLDIYEVQTSSGVESIIESFEVSFDPSATDNSGDSIWISYVLNTYSSVLRAQMTLPNPENDTDPNDITYTPGFNLIKNYDTNVGTVSVVKTASATITDNKQDFSQWEGTGGIANYMVIAQDNRGNTIYGYIGEVTPDNETAVVYQNLSLTTQGWINDTTLFNINSTITYQVKKYNLDISTVFSSSIPVPLKKGSDGSLVDSTGKLVPSIATQVLADAYAGTIDDAVLDTENQYFSMVFDAGYPSSVKTQISNLAVTRADCCAIMDNSDNNSVSAALTTRENTNAFNNFYTALYEPFNNVYDIFTGSNIWVSPVFHMSYLLPSNDKIAELWFAAAGFNRGAISSITQMRFNAKQGERDALYLARLNPIVKFNEGYTVFGNLTTQYKDSKMENLSVVRCVLYIKRAIERYCRFFIFEQNDAITWSKISNEITPFLDDVKCRRGLNSYSVSVGATDYELKTKRCHVSCTLNPETPLEIILPQFFIV
jgi:hypothetical protein